MSLRSAFRQLEAALRDLVGKDVLLKERLDAAIGQLDGLRGEDFPPDLRDEFNLLADMIRLYKAGKYLPEIEPEIAHAILQLFTNLVSFTGLIHM